MLHNKRSIRFLDILLLLVLIAIFSLSSCEEDSMSGPTTHPSVAIDHTQVPVQYQSLKVNGVTSPDNGWIVLRRGTADAPNLTEHLLEPIKVAAGATLRDTTWNINSLSIEDGEILWVALHKDEGSDGTPDIDGESAADPIYREGGEPVVEWVTVESPDVGVSDKYTGKNILVVDSVKVGGPSWIVVTTESGAVVGTQTISKGIHNNVEVTLDTIMVYTDSTLALWVWTNKNQTESESFDPNEDKLEYFGEETNTIWDPMAVIPPTGEFLQTNPGVPDTVILSQNTFVVDSLLMSHKGWVVVHEDAGGSIGPIISEATSVGAGQSEDTQVPFNSTTSLDAGMTVWPMLHTDNGVIDKWEFGLKPDFDAPILDGGAPVVSEYIVEAPTINVEDQAIVLDSIKIESAMIGVHGWVVLHDQDRNIVGTTELENTGMYSNVGIELTSDISVGEVLTAMLHIDTDPFGEFFYSAQANSGDIPEVFGFDVDGNGVIVQDTFTILEP